MIRRTYWWISCSLGLALCAIVSGTPAFSATLVCDPDELTNAVSRAVPGSEIVLCDRVWKDTEINISVRATASNPVRITAQTPGDVVLTGASAVLMSGSFVIVDGLVFTGNYTGEKSPVEFRNAAGDCNDCRLTNSAFIDFNAADPTFYRAWVSIAGRRNLVDHNYFSGKTHRGPLVAVSRGDDPTPDDARIEYNYFSRPPVGAENNGESVQVGQQAPGTLSNAVVSRNYFFEADGELEAISIKASEVTVIGNTIESSQGTITLRQGSNNRVEGNFILGNGRSMTGGIRVIGPGHVVANNYISDIDPDGIPVRGAIVLHSGESNDPIAKYTAVRDALVANNTIVNAGRSILAGEGADTMMPEDVVVANNIVWGASGPLIANARSLVNPRFLNNIFFGASSGLAADAGQILLDPRLKPDAVGLWRPAADSPARGAGAPIPNVTVDILQRDRIEPYDIGAFNVGTTPGPISRPLGRCDVGPMTFDPDGSDCIGVSRPKPPEQLTRQ